MLEQEIMDFSKDRKRTGVWISTQIVEASLDIDFDELHTEMCTIDSLFQRMGRIYRGHDRFYYEKAPNIYIYTQCCSGVNGHNAFIDKDIFNYSLTVLENYDGHVLTEEDKQVIIDKVYDPVTNPEILKSAYYTDTVAHIDYLKGLYQIPYSLEKEDIKFRDILSDTVIPKSIYDELDRQGILMQQEEELKSSYVTRERRQEIIDDIMDCTIQLSKFYDNMNFKISSTILKEAEKQVYDANGILICEHPYDFDSDKKRGLGLNRYSSIDDKNPKESDSIW